MLVGDKLIYLQLQKTGSTRITDLIRSTVGAEERTKHHRVRPADLEDPALAGRRFVGSVRNPWTYYVSLWAYGNRRAGGIYERTTGRPRWDRPDDERGSYDRDATPTAERDEDARRRAQVWKRAYSKANPRRPVRRTARLLTDRQRFRRWLHLLNDPEYRGDVGEGYGRSPIAEHSGLLTYRYVTLYTVGGSGPVLDTYDKMVAYADEHLLCQDVIRMEHLADDLEAALLAAGYDLDDDQRAALRVRTEDRRENPSTHRRAAWYYDDETRELVARRDRFVIERHGYEFG
jgi:hypothetical protein